jgi:hypothetical protein
MNKNFPLPASDVQIQRILELTGSPAPVGITNVQADTAIFLIMKKKSASVWQIAIDKLCANGLRVGGHVMLEGKRYKVLDFNARKGIRLEKIGGGWRSPMLKYVICTEMTD